MMLEPMAAKQGRSWAAGGGNQHFALSPGACVEPPPVPAPVSCVDWLENPGCVVWRDQHSLFTHSLLLP